jgi:ATP-dependent Lhr-like helicase
LLGVRVLGDFHPAVRTWFERSFPAPTDVQRQAWPSIAAGRHTLLAAPTGSGKTLAAFLAAIDALVREGLATGLPNETRVLYISPLKALSNDIQKNLEQPLAGINAVLDELAHAPVHIRATVRTGDTDANTRNRMRREPPHILVTTPESAYILLTSDSGRRMLSTVRAVIVDEIHALAGTKRGAHLAITLERLEALTGAPPVRIGCSATQKPIERMAQFLVGVRDSPCTIVDTGHIRSRDLALELPRSMLEAVMANEVWSEVYDRLAELVNEHRTTLVFANARRLTERVTKHLSERLGAEHVTAHHGSLSRELRFDAEQRLKSGRLKCLVTTSSLELGIDIGDVDLVCQLGSPRSIAAFLQRVGRSGHQVTGNPKGRLFPLTRDDLIECTALLRAARDGDLDQIRLPRKPLDVLSQQIVAEVAGREWGTTELFDAFRRALPYRDLERAEFDDVVQMLADGFSTRRGRRGAYLHLDAVNGRLRARRGARLTAVTNAGTIPDQFDYDVILDPEGLRVGSVNEDFAFESLPGHIFQLGNSSYRILKIGQGRVHVADARGEPPTIPFWFGEAPARTSELSGAVSALRTRVDTWLKNGIDAAIEALERDYVVPHAAAIQLAVYLAAVRAVLGEVPTQQRVVMERFFDETGSMHLVVHSPYGSRLNRAWGLALRKRFCRKFNFELQAAALEDAIVLSLGVTHSFPVDEPARYLSSQNARGVLEQAVLAAPMFGTRWRWVSSIALAIRRNRNGKRAPAQFQRSDSEDLLAVLFPDQIACAENLPGSGDREIPDHPLVRQTLIDCMTDVADIDGLETLLRSVESGDVVVRGIDTPTPSALAQEILSAKPYAFLDDTPAEERRTLAVQSRRFLDPTEAGDLAKLDPEAIQRVREEVAASPRDADELHDALVVLGFLTAREGEKWSEYFATLAADRRATVAHPRSGDPLWVAAERLAEVRMLLPEATLEPPIAAVAARAVGDASIAARELLRSRLEGLGPITAAELGAPLQLTESAIVTALTMLETEGFVMRGRFTAAATVPDAPLEWCERRLLARIHRYTISKLRREIAPVSPADYLRFLLDWHGLTDRRRGTEALEAVMEQLEGFSASAAAWEGDILPARLEGYAGDQLDSICRNGRITWLRLAVRPQGDERRTSPVRLTPIALVDRLTSASWREIAESPSRDDANLTSGAAKVLDAIERAGATFFDDLLKTTGLLKSQLEEALGELVNWGLVTSDSFSGLRALITPADKRPSQFAARRRRELRTARFESAGRWSLLPRETIDHREAVAHVAITLLHRYGVVFRKVLEREPQLPPWRELLPIYWRMEARGEVRGGRFVDRFSGEQFALPDAVTALRQVRRRESGDDFIRITAADPLNLVGIITGGERIPAIASNTILFRGGVPVAARVGNDVVQLDNDQPIDGDVRRHLTLRPVAGF